MTRFEKVQNQIVEDVVEAVGEKGGWDKWKEVHELIDNHELLKFYELAIKHEKIADVVPLELLVYNRGCGKSVEFKFKEIESAIVQDAANKMRENKLREINEDDGWEVEPHLWEWHLLIKPYWIAFQREGILEERELERLVLDELVAVGN